MSKISIKNLLEEHSSNKTLIPAIQHTFSNDPNACIAAECAFYFLKTKALFKAMINNNNQQSMAGGSKILHRERLSINTNVYWCDPPVDLLKKVAKRYNTVPKLQYIIKVTVLSVTTMKCDIIDVELINLN